MKAPDKIYIPFYPNYDGIDTHLSDEWFEGKAIDHVEGWVEYIRKDALIEWMKGYNHPITRLVIQEIIDKMNSM